MISTKKYFLQRAILISLMSIIICLMLVDDGRNSGLFVFLIIVLALFGQRIMKKAGLTHGNPFKTASDGYSNGLKHDDEREAKNASVASFISARITIVLVMLVMGLVAVFLNGNTWDFFGWSISTNNFFTATSFGVFGTAILLVQQWSFFFSFVQLNK